MKFRKLVAAALALTMVMTAALASADTIKIAVQGPLTGAAAVYGNAVINGAKLGADYVNAMDPDYQVALINEDDEHDPEKAINAYNNALDAGAQMMLGATTTAPCIAVAAQAYEDRVFVLTPSASSPAVNEGKDNVYQVCFSDPNQGLASAEYIVSHDLAKNVAIIYNNADSYSTGIYQTFVDKAAELGLNVVATSTCTDDTTDFSVQVNAAKDAGADLVFLPIYYTPASQILAYANSIEYAPIFFGVDGLDGLLTMEGFDTSLAEGVMLLTPFSADAEDDLTKMFVEQYKAEFGEVPNQFAADAFDGVVALYTACKQTGVTGETALEEVCEKMISVFPTMEINGLTGDMVWSADGTVTKTPTAVVIKDGVYVGFEK